MRVLKSMELGDEQKLDAVHPIPMDTKPDYPYGLRICLTKAEFDKLGLDPKDAEVGGMVHLIAIARITSIMHHDSENTDAPDCRVELQIEDLDVDSPDEE